MQYTVYRLVYTRYKLVYNSIYSVYTLIHFFQVRRFRAYLDSLSMDGFADKTEKRAAAGSGWTPAELNNILQAHVVDGALTTFGCVEWESDLFRGTMRARCYPFDMPKRRFHSLNTKVCHSVLCTSYLHIPHSLWYILGYTKLYLVYTSIYQVISGIYSIY